MLRPCAASLAPSSPPGLRACCPGCEAARPPCCALLRRAPRGQTFVGDKINAGIYVLSPTVLERIELRPTSIEKETFPLIVRDKGLYAFTLPGYWMDVGQPKDYLAGAQPPATPGPALMVPACARCRPVASQLTQPSGCPCWSPSPAEHSGRHWGAPAGLGLHLRSMRNTDPGQLAQGPSFVGDNIVHPTAKIGQNCKIGPNVAIGIECEVADGVRISNSVLLHRVKVCPGPAPAATGQALYLRLGRRPRRQAPLSCSGAQSFSRSCCVVSHPWGWAGQAPELPSVQVSNFGRIADSIVGWGSSTGQWARIENRCVIGEDVHIKVCPAGCLCGKFCSPQSAELASKAPPALWASHAWQPSPQLAGAMPCCCAIRIPGRHAGRGPDERHHCAAAQGDQGEPA